MYTFVCILRILMYISGTVIFEIHIIVTIMTIIENKTKID